MTKENVRNATPQNETQENQSTAVAAPRNQGTIKEWLQRPKFKNEVAKALPKHLTADRFIRVATTALNREPKLRKCTQASFFECLMNLSQLGLEPDGRRAHLIPFKSKSGGYTCQLIIDYKGLVELAMRSNKIANIHADVVCENDEFEYDRGEVVKHKVDFRKPRGKVYAAYAICSFKDGTKKAEAMSRDEIEGIRKRSKAGNDGPWMTDWNEMAKKTVFRRLSKWLPLSPEYRDVLDVDADVIDIHAESHAVDDFADDLEGADIPTNGMDALAERLKEQRKALEKSPEDEAAACNDLRRQIAQAITEHPIDAHVFDEMMLKVGSLDGDIQKLGGGQLEKLLELMFEHIHGQEAGDEEDSGNGESSGKKGE